jgi:hypothetical protein
MRDERAFSFARLTRDTNRGWRLKLGRHVAGGVEERCSGRSGLLRCAHRGKIDDAVLDDVGVELLDDFDFQGIIEARPSRMRHEPLQYRLRLLSFLF